MSPTTNPEKLTARLNSLILKKKNLDKRIEVYYAERVKDEYVNNLKIEKVKLNDEIVKVRNLITNQEIKDG